MEGRALRPPGWLAAACVAAAALALGQPAPIPELYVHIESPAPGAARLEVRARVQFVPPESLDLVRRAPAAAHLPRLEALLGAEPMVLQPLDAAASTYRTAMPRGAPLQWSYELRLGRDESLPVALGEDHACVWLGGVLLEPRAAGGAPAVERLFLGARALPRGLALGPWPHRDGLFWPADADDLADNFLALGAWRVDTLAAPPCTLVVASAGAPAAHALAWAERLRADLQGFLPASGGALACLAGGTAPRLFLARRSLLVRWPTAEPPSAGALRALAAGR